MSKITLRTRFLRASIVGLTGMVVAIVITQFERPFAGDWGFVRCAAAGAFLSGLLLARCFGGRGSWGMFCSGMGFAGATILGAIFAVILMPIEHAAAQGLSLMDGHLVISGGIKMSLMGPAYVLTLIAENLWIAVAWLAMWGGLHLSAQYLGSDA